MARWRVRLWIEDIAEFPLRQRILVEAYYAAELARSHTSNALARYRLKGGSIEKMALKVEGVVRDGMDVEETPSGLIVLFDISDNSRMRTSGYSWRGFVKLALVDWRLSY